MQSADDRQILHNSSSSRDEEGDEAALTGEHEDDCQTLCTQLVEKLYHFAEDPEAIQDFTQHEILYLVQFMIGGLYLNDEKEVCFYPGRRLSSYLRNWKLNRENVENARETIRELRQLDAAKENVDLYEAFSNLINLIVCGFIKSI